MRRLFACVFACVLVLLLTAPLCWSQVTRLGQEQFGNSSNASSQAITVNASATLAVLFVAGYSGTANYFSGGTAPTINSVSMTPQIDGDDNGSQQQAVAYTLKNPSTGSQTLAWDWAGSGAPSEGLVYCVVYVSGEHATSYVGDTAIDVTSSTSHTTGSLTATSGDLFLGYSSSYSGADDTTWTNATERTGSTQASNWSEMADASPSGNITVSITTGDAYSCLEGLIILQASGGGGGSVPALMHYRRQMQ